MTYIKLKVDEAKIEEIRDFYECEYIENQSNPYLLFQTKTDDGVIVNAYKSKNMFTIVFSGEKEATISEASIFEDEEIIMQSLTEVDENKSNNEDNRLSGYKDLTSQIGSDEVGVGDLFGPLVVCASYIEPKDIPFLESLNVQDSKKMSDSTILSIGDELGKKIRSAVIVCSSKKLCSLKEQGWSMHKIMANLHNQCHINLLKSNAIPNNTIIYIDQFESSDLYFKYLVTPRPNESHHIHFETKGESSYPSIAVSSVLARYHFLLSWNKMEKELGTIIPKGASIEVDKCLNSLLKKYDRDFLEPYIKTFFRNYQETKDQ